MKMDIPKSRELPWSQVRDIYLPVFLVGSAFCLLLTEKLVHYPIAVMGLLGIWHCAREPRLLRDPPLVAISIAFALIWIPMLIALIDAAAAERSAKTTWLYLHFLPAGWYIVTVGRRPEVHRLITQVVAGLAIFVALDAFVQLLWGSDLFGYPYEHNILKGVFYPKQRLGLFLAVLAPIYIETLADWSKRYGVLWILLIPMTVVMLMSLKRSAWLMLAVVALGYAALKWRGAGFRFSRTSLAAGVLVFLVAILTVTSSPILKSRDIARQCIDFQIDHIAGFDNTMVDPWIALALVARETVRRMQVRAATAKRGRRSSEIDREDVPVRAKTSAREGAPVPAKTSVRAGEPGASAPSSAPSTENPA